MNDFEKDLQQAHQGDLDEIKKIIRKLEVIYQAPGGLDVTMRADPNNPKDIDALLKASREFFESDFAKSIVKSGETRRLQEQIQAVQAAADTVPASPTIHAGATITEMIERYATRKDGLLAAKTMYEYRNYQTIFKDWISVRKNVTEYPIAQVSRADVADFIDQQRANGISAQTIQQKYLGSLNGLFDLAKAIGSFPHEAVYPTRGHKLFTKRDARKSHEKKGWKPFTSEELKSIFDPAQYMAQKNPTDYWLPLLGLFTGGRISELCQLMVADVHKVNEIWAISITDEDECQRLKTLAAKRTIPVHPKLIELGFIDFVVDMEAFNGMLFPYLTANAFGNFSETPSERFGKYLDQIKITERQKVFHSFRSTSNNCLKQNKVPEETRCQFIGHEYDSVNSAKYSLSHDVEYLLKNVASNLNFELPFFDLKYPRKRILEMTKRKMLLKRSHEKNKQAKMEKSRVTLEKPNSNGG